MVAGSILPVALHKGKLHFLFGKENPMEDSAKGFSDFGGRVDAGETPFTAALREGSEELTGFLGNKEELEELITKNGGIIHTLAEKSYTVHMFLIDYDANLPKYYNLNHRFLWEKMDNNYLNDSKLFEKIEIQWFTSEMMKQRRGDFRNFYQEIVDLIIKDVPNILKLVGAKNKKHKSDSSAESSRRRSSKLKKR
jgi:hypothetical protein